MVAKKKAVRNVKVDIEAGYHLYSQRIRCFGPLQRLRYLEPFFLYISVAIVVIDAFILRGIGGEMGDDGFVAPRVNRTS